MSKKETAVSTTDVGTTAEVDVGQISDNVDALHRKLGARQVQLMAIGGTIGTAVFVSMGGALHKGGPGSLLIAYILYAIVIGMVNNGVAEMTTYMPVSGGFIRLGGKWVDDAWGFMAGWNFFLYEALCIPFEITALCTVLGFWRDDIPVAAVCAACVVLYATINVLAVRAYGEAEFWLSGGKVFLIAIVFSFTFFTMVGANPKHDPYGFRYWKNPGAFAEHIDTGSLGKFEGFLACLWSASFTVVGPEYISMISAESKRPRILIKNAFKTVYWRFGAFFIGSALCIGIVIPYNDPTLVAILTGKKGGGGSAAASPYVIAMQNLGVSGLPHLVNGLLVTSIFSAGNTYTYCASRSIYGLALEGRAPAFLKKCTKKGVPIFAIALTMIFPMLSFLQVGSGSSVVLGWLIDLITAGGLINYISMMVTYLRFYYGMKAQNKDRSALPYFAWYQPYCGWIGLVSMVVVVLTYGYTSFYPWDVGTFFSYYALVIVAVFNFIVWKLIKRTKFVKATEMDLVWEAPMIDAYEATFMGPPSGFWTEMIQMFGFKREEGREMRKSSIAVPVEVSKELRRASVARGSIGSSKELR